MVKQTLFLDQHDTSAPLSFVASKIPNIRKTGNITKDSQVKLQRKAYVRLVDGLWKNPQLIVLVKEHFEELLDNETSVGSSSSAASEKACVITLRNIEENWAISWIMRVSGLSQATVEKMKAYDTESIRHMLVWALGAPIGMRLTDACKDLEITAAAFDLRATQLGDRLRALVSKYGFIDLVTGAICWGKFWQLCVEV